jgi:hypothetical protein
VPNNAESVGLAGDLLASALGKLDLEVTHACVGLVIHVNKPFLMTKHFSN